ncbi:MAG: hypothetical protein WCG97_00640 [bacterium]
MSKSSRIIFSAFLVASVFIFPWWFFSTITIVAMWRMDKYFFALFIGFLADLLYASPFVLRDYNTLHTFLLKWPFTLTMTLAFVIFDLIKKRIRI